MKREREGTWGGIECVTMTIVIECSDSVREEEDWGKDEEKKKKKRKIKSWYLPTNMTNN